MQRRRKLPAKPLRACAARRNRQPPDSSYGHEQPAAPDQSRALVAESPR